MHGLWSVKFKNAARGLWLAIRGERSFVVHLPMAVAVGVLAAVLKVSLSEAVILALCLTIVLMAEIFNTAIEHLARAITSDHRPEIATALDVAGGAVLVAA